MSLSKDRHIDEVVTNCCSCPFHYSQPEAISLKNEYGGEASIEAGSSCLHPKNREGNRIASLTEMDEVGITAVNTYLRHVYGEPFPPICPLARKELGNKISGQRDIDLT